MFYSKLQNLLECLAADQYITAGDLAEKLDLSERTIRTRVKELDDILRQNGAYIESKPRFGYRIVIEDSEAYGHLLENKERDEGFLPNSTEERVHYLLAYFLNQNDYVKMDDLSEFLYVSKSTLVSAMKQVEMIFAEYDIQFDRRAHHGIKIVGNEINQRRCIGEYFIKRKGFANIEQSRQDEELREIANIAYPLLQKHKIKFSETAFENFISMVYVGRKRMTRDRIVEIDADIDLNFQRKEHDFLEELIHSLEEKYDISYPESEKKYVALHLAGKRMMGSAEKNELNFVVRSDLDQMVLKMLEVVCQEFHVDLRNDFDLRMSLNQHMTPFDIRMRFGISLENPMLEEIKENYMLGYRMASVASVVLAEHYKKEISEDELGYFALLFALAMEKQKIEIEKKNILIVCSSGKGSSRLLKYTYQREFGSYLHNIYVCDLIELEEFNFNRVDYVFTTVPIRIHIPVPILEVGLFLEESDIRRVKKVLRLGNAEFMAKYYKEEAFLTGITGTDRYDVLGQMCDIIMHDRQVPDNFYDLVVQREELGSTDYGNLVAIPHPMQTVTEDTFVYVAILENPILWSRHEVQVVMLTAIGEKEDPDLQRFYELTMQVIVNPEAIRELIRKKEYQLLLDYFEKLN